MQNQQQSQSDWLKAAASLNDELKQQSKETQDAIKKLSKRQYPR